MTLKYRNTISSIVFTGHMIDLPDRKEERFPRSLEAPAREAIHARIATMAGSNKRSLIGYASGARGGDILFHEQCRTMDIHTVMVLPFAPNIFEKTSVAGVPRSDWIARFHRLWNETAPDDRINLNLPETDEAYDICNTRLLELARENGQIHLIALWNGKSGDGHGGTLDMISKARLQGDFPDIIDPKGLKC